VLATEFQLKILI